MCAVLMEYEEDYTEPDLLPAVEPEGYASEDNFAMVALHITEED